MSTDFSPGDFNFNFSLEDDSIVIEKQNNTDILYVMATVVFCGTV
jgi:hypothetical protein